MAKREAEQIWVWLDDPAFSSFQQIGAHYNIQSAYIIPKQTPAFF